MLIAWCLNDPKDYYFFYYYSSINVNLWFTRNLKKMCDMGGKT